MTELYQGTFPLSDWIGLDNALREQRKEHLTMVTTAEPAYYLSASTLSSVLNIQDALDSGIDVVRVLHDRATKYSVVALAPGTFMFSYAAEEGRFPDDALERTLKAVRDALNEAGDAGAVIDQSSAQGNDILINGKKVCGGTITTVQSKIFSRYFISWTIDYKMFDRISLPDKKFEGKSSKTIKQRATSLQEEGLNIDIETFQDHLRKTLHDRLPFNQFQERSIPDDVQDRAAEVAETVTDRSHLFER